MFALHLPANYKAFYLFPNLNEKFSTRKEEKQQTLKMREKKEIIRRS